MFVSKLLEDEAMDDNEVHTYLLDSYIHDCGKPYTDIPTGY